MAQDLGYLFFDNLTFKSPPIVNGRPIPDLQTGLNLSRLPAGTSVALLLGGQVFQQTKSTNGAPLDLEPHTYAWAGKVTDEGDYKHLMRLPSSTVASPIVVFIEDPIEDVWIIPSAVKTIWTLSRFTSFDLLGHYALYTPSARIAPFPEATEAQEIVQTIVNASPPSAGEVFVDAAIRGTTIETPDISADVGKALIFTYHPVRLFTVESSGRRLEESNVFEFELEMVEHVEERDWAS